MKSSERNKSGIDTRKIKSAKFVTKLRLMWTSKFSLSKTSSKKRKNVKSERLKKRPSKSYKSLRGNFQTS